MGMKQRKNKNQNNVEATVNPSAVAFDSRMQLFIIACSAMLIYLPSLSYQLTYYDDATLIENMSKFITGRESFFELFSQSVFGTSQGSGDYFYRPLLNLTFYFDSLINGNSLIGFHITNLIIHAAASCLLYLFFLKLKFNRLLSFTVTLIFAVHPALVQAVAWIPGRNDALLTLTALASILFLLHYTDNGKPFYLALHFLLFFMSLLTKETAVLLPVVFYLTRKLDVNDKPKDAVSSYGLILGWVFFIVIFFGVRSAVLGASVGMPLTFAFENFIHNLPALPQYIGKLLLPFNLSVFPILRDTTYVFAIVTIVGLMYLLYVSKNLRKNYILLSVCWLFLFLLPAILRTSADYESVFLEHRLYFPMVGFLMLCMETDLVKNISTDKPVSKIIIAGIIVLFAILNIRHSNHFKDEYSYWFSAVSTSPNSSFAHKGLGTSYLTSGNSTNAIKEYETAIQLNPALKEVRNNLGRIYLNNGQLEKAGHLFDEELSINPSNAVCYYNLALLRLKQNSVKEAEVLIRKSIALDPDYRDAQNDLCVILAMQKKYEEAVQLCIYILKQDPDYESAKSNLRLIFEAWKDAAKISYYNNELKTMGITI
jgi:Flp pilus assembly protein TadD